MLRVCIVVRGRINATTVSNQFGILLYLHSASATCGICLLYLLRYFRPSVVRLCCYFSGRDQCQLAPRDLISEGAGVIDFTKNREVSVQCPASCRFLHKFRLVYKLAGLYQHS